MSQAPSMPLYCDAYLADTMHLSLEEHGAYLKLLMITWRNNGAPLPDDDARLARMLGVTVPRWRERLRPVLVEFFNIVDETWAQKRLQKEWDFTQQKIEKNRENGSKGGRPRSLKNNEIAKANGSVSLNPNQTQPESTHPHPQKEEGGGGVRTDARDPSGSGKPPSTEAEQLVAHFEAMRRELWPNDPNFPAPRMTLLTHAAAYLDQGAPLELAKEVVERGMRTAARQGKSATGSLKAFHRSMADAIANHRTPPEGGHHDRPIRPGPARHNGTASRESLDERERRDRAGIISALAGELEPGGGATGALDP